MDMNWRRGDIGIVHSVPPDCIGYEFNGSEVNVTSSVLMLCIEVDARNEPGVYIEPVISSDGRVIRAATLDTIRKKPYNGNEKTTWNEDIFVPSTPITIEA
jgi:hypothetical protein